ncbi:MAG: hypothetical protein HY552_01360 [Elusimicrobia bacterium]|nr:hypothetical protein [Elusimicrobiota bacterium]
MRHWRPLLLGLTFFVAVLCLAEEPAADEPSVSAACWTVGAVPGDRTAPPCAAGASAAIVRLGEAVSVVPPSRPQVPAAPVPEPRSLSPPQAV